LFELAMFDDEARDRARKRRAVLALEQRLKVANVRAFALVVDQLRAEKTDRLVEHAIVKRIDEIPWLGVAAGEMTQEVRGFFRGVIDRQMAQVDHVRLRN